jgi:DNA primase
MLTDMYTETQILNVIQDIGINLVSETGNDFTALCPFHSNRFSPAFSISKKSGEYICFSPECGVRGTLPDLIMKITSRNEFEAARLIAKRAIVGGEKFINELESIMEEKQTFNGFSEEVLDRLYDQMCQLPTGRDYLNGRGFTDETIDHFRIGYSAKEDMVTVPVHSPDGLPIGLIGRGVKDKTFKNSYKLQKSKTLFNIHRAKKSGGIAIVTEASFDVAKIYQAGFGDVGVAIMGGTLSKDQHYLLNRYFSKIIIFTDFDNKEDHINKGFCRKCNPSPCTGHNPGRDLGQSIADKLGNKEILWATYEPNVSVYADGAKDATDMTDVQVKQCIDNAMPHFEYVMWNPY